MTYLVQKTNMFKQKMKIDDKITGSKMHTEQIQDSCTGFQRVGFTLSGFMIHYLHRLVKLFVVNLQSTVTGIIKVLNKSLGGHSINDLLAFRRAQLNVTQFGDGSLRVGLPRTIETQVVRMGHFLPFLSFWTFRQGSAFLAHSSQFSESKAPIARSSRKDGARDTYNFGSYRE